MTIDFKTVPHITVEDGCASKALGPLITKKWGQSNILICTDVGLVKLGLLKGITQGLEDAGHCVAIYDGVEADPPEQNVLDAAALGNAHGCTVVLGFGGGSPMDVAKVVAVLMKGEQPLSEMYGSDNVKSSRFPLLHIPTTAGTGSEVTPYSVITTGATSKNSVVSPVLYADVALLDATLTTGLPQVVTAATGIDAMVHAIEAYTTKFKKNPISDALALKALSIMAKHIEAACFEPNNLEARRAMLLGSMMAGQAFANAPVAGIHALAYPLGGIYHIPHGYSNALVMPHVMAYTQSVCADLYAEIADVMLVDVKGDDAAKSEALIAYLTELPKRLGLEVQLSAMGIEETALDMLAEDAMIYQRMLMHNRKEIDLAAAKAIYRAAF